MGSFFEFFSKGFNSFLYLNIFGHALFVATLCGVYTMRSWKTAYSFILTFIAGALLTFILAQFDIIDIPQITLQFLVPITIIVTGFSNFFTKKQVFTNRYPSQNYRYYLAFLSGIIHGFAFDKGLSSTAEFGGISGYAFGWIFATALFVFALLFLAFILTYFLRVRLREWNLIISGACTGIAAFKMLMNMY